MTHINYIIHISWPQEEFVNQPGTKSTTFGSADQAVKSTDLEEGRGFFGNEQHAANTARDFFMGGLQTICKLSNWY